MATVLPWEAEILCEREKVCVCVHASWLKGLGGPVGAAYHKKACNFPMDSQTCRKFCGKMHVCILYGSKYLESVLVYPVTHI